MPEPKPITVLRVNFDPELTRNFEDWRRAQPRIPSAAEAVRQLIGRQLKVERSYSALAEAAQHV